MIDPSRFLETLERRGVAFFAGIPDSTLKAFGRALADRLPSHRHVVAANEGSAVGLAIGHHLATGGLACVYMQNSGLGHAANPLASLAAPDVYGVPMLLIVGWRGELVDGVQLADEPQHKQQGRITLPMLDCLEVPYAELGPGHTDAEAAAIVEGLVTQGLAQSRPVALVVRRGVLDVGGEPLGASRYALSREEALLEAVSALPPDTIYVATTGKISRELYDHRRAAGIPPGWDFLSVGAMGHALQIAAGVALARPDRRVACLDGDGAFIMHMGGLAVAATTGNLIHLVINNGAHESAGGGATQGFALDMPAIAKACGYTFVGGAQTRSEISARLGEARATAGPAFIEIRTNAVSRADLPRPPHALDEAKSRFMRRLISGGPA